jgi:N-acetylmuramoyl-L-alanine amidase
MLGMMLARIGVSISRTIAWIPFWALFVVSSIQARQWDSAGAARAFDEARQKRTEITQSSQPLLGLYLECAKAYRKVHRLDPHFGHTPDAIFEEGLVYQEMGEKFGDLSYYRTAINRFQLLVQDYGGSRNCPAALLRIADICTKHLKDENGAQDAYQILKTRYKQSDAARELGTRTPITKPTPEVPPSVIPSETPSTQQCVIQNVHYWTIDDHLRVSIDIDHNAKYSKEILSNPSRIYFDILNAKVGNALSGSVISVDNALLQQIRIAQRQSDTVRVVLDLPILRDYSISESHDPFRIAIDLYPSAESKAAAPKVHNPDVVPRSEAAAAKTAMPGKSLSEPQSTKPIVPSPAPIQTAKTTPPAKAVEPKKQPPPLAITDLPSSVSKAEKSSKENQSQKTALSAVTVLPTALPKTAKPEPSTNPGDGVAQKTESKKPDVDAKSLQAANPKAAPPTSFGDRTLTRMLGLKIGKIVIDPGHGGYDLGTVGPGGLYEKDLVLSIAHDLQKLIQEQLGAEVFLTRNDDSFISLEERTAIANQHRADLFISIHANSSRNRTISGVETYYLDFAKSDTEREIAARENATTASSVHELEDLIKKIAQADKSAESRELASIVQKNLFSGAHKLFPAAQNRGVRSAPFIVLIGANMPSVLAEVAFISNPRDERLLKKTSNQEQLVKALFSGIEVYIKTLGSDLVQNQTNK